MRVEIMQMEPRTPSPDDTIFVALGKDLKEGETILLWTLHNSRGRKFCILLIHQPAQRIPMMGSKVSISKLGDQQVRAYHENEKQLVHKILDKYISTCARAGARAEKLYLEMDSIEKGIVQIISEHGIKWLVMGAAANKSYSRKMKELKSKKAKYVHLNAPSYCHIWFVCKGHLIHTRESKLHEVDVEVEVEVESSSLQASPCIDTTHSSLRSDSVTEGHNVRSPVSAYGMDRSENHGKELSAPSDVYGGVTPQSRLNLEGSIDFDRSSSVGSPFSMCMIKKIEDSTSLSLARIEVNGISSNLAMLSNDNEHHSNFAVASSAIEGTMKDELYDRLKQFVMEAEKARQQAYEESIRRKKAEKDVIDAIHRAKACESMLAEELSYRREIEEALARDKEEVAKVKYQLDEVMKEIEVAYDQKSILDCQIASSTKSIEKLDQEIFSTLELVQKYTSERDELRVEYDNALMVAEQLRKKQDEETSSSAASQFFCEFSFAEIEFATNSFDESLKICEGRYGVIYKGLLRHTQVAVKILHPNSLQGVLEFHSEVNILNKLRHPNLVTLIGVCEEELTLVYEYLPSGSLEDCLNCKDNTFPLSWQTRIRIAADICSALTFLHSSRPRVLHGALNPANILLDSNFVAKLKDFGKCCDEFSDNSTTLSIRIVPTGTSVYMDPEFLATGELTSKSDVYSLGIILLRLLTGRPACGITKEVLCALDEGNLKDLLDSTAGDWPFVQAKQLAHLAISCCEMNGRRRPDLVSDVWRVLKPMGRGSFFQLGSKEFCQIPSYFICPIFQEIMQDPVVAADGFTYEAEALKGWIETGHDTSPMTNLKLPDCNRVPNHALRSTIQEWLQQP